MNQKVICLLYYNYIKMFKVVVSLCFFLLWERAIHLGTCSQAETVDVDAFTIQHKTTGRCLTAEGLAGLGLASCPPASSGETSHIWKWGSGHRLFNVAKSLCLGLHFPTKALRLFHCSFEDPADDSVLSWRCPEGALLHTDYQTGLAVTDGKVVGKRDAADSWTRDGTQENVCQRPYRVVHTSDGNSAGAPCEFPFLANGSWHHGCLPEQDSAGTFWCSTTSDFDHDRKNGRCLIPEEGCGRLFAPAAEETCLQFVSGAAVTWQEALDSCRSQGSDLLSLGGPGDLNSSTFKAGLSRMPEKMWMGLHQLDMAEGWQWSDGSGVAYLRWEEEMPSTSSLSESDCGALNSKQNYVSESCTARLPYVCKKSSKASHQATEASEYKATVCPDGWVPWNGWCYRLVKDGPKGFEEAQAHCKSTELGGGGTLASLHSLDTKEMISTYFYTEGSPPDVWIGLKWIDTSTVFRWADGTPVNFTYWGPNQPSQPKQYSSCVFLSGESHGWRVGNCTDRRPFLCQREGKVNETTTQSACPAQGGWRRHGNSCFQVNTAEVSFKDHCNITIRNGFEQAFLSRLLGEQMGNGTRYFWMGLQDVKNTGEYQWLSPDSITYTNWGSVEPSHDGGCAVMSKAKPIGKWEVKNCTDFKAGTICKKELSPPPPVKPEPDPNLPCPDGWLSRPQIKYCYKVFHGERLSRKRSWEEAQRFCQALGANLASFNKEDEMDALHSVMRDSISDSRYFWVGLNRRNPADRSWSWSDGRPVSMGILQQEFHEDDAYKRDCTAFKSMKSSFRRMVWVMLHDLRHATFYAIPFRCDAKLEWVCQIPKGKTPKVPEWYNPGGHHETSIFVDNSEFWFVKEPRLTFDEAGLFCSMNGSKLAAPVSFIAASKIHQYLDETSDSPNQSWWADMQWPGRFFPMRFSQMHFYHSVFLGRCTSISAENQFPEYEYSCERPLPFVCERHNITLVERNPLEADPRGFTCGNATLAFRDKCFILLTPSTQASFSLANEECMSLGSTLVTVSDQVEQDFITTLLPKMPEMQNIWIGLKLRSDYPEWVDATPVSFLNFNPLLHGMLKPIRINTLIPESMQLCAYMINHHSSDVMATWDYSPCTEFQYSSICQHYADKPEKTQEPQGPIHINNHTIQVLWKNLTWSEARQQCRDLGMDLASVADVFLQASLTVLVSRARMPMWIGLVSEDEGIHYRWSDNSHTVFSRWSSETSSGACVYLDTDGFWKATECDEMLGGAICHVPHEETIKKAEEAPVKCPHTIKGPNWIPFRNNCYSIQLVSSRWDNVQKGRIQDTCKNLYGSATILTIRNADENEFIRQQLLPFSSLVQYVWLGLFKDDNDNQMKWYDGTDVQYSNWRNGRPDVAGEFMAGLKADGIWELITNNQYIAPFRQRSVVACKVDNEPREKYNQTMKKIQNYGNLTYQVVTRKLNWFQAVEECGRRGGHLASIHDIQHDVHMEFITRTDSFPLWIGLSSQGISASSRSEWTRSDHLSYEWSDGTRYEYSASISDSQKTPSIPPQQGCVFVNATGGWVRSDCHALLDGAICYNTSITTSSQRAKLRMSTVSSNCPPTNDSSTWVEFRDHCYAINMSFYHSQVYNMQQAQGICQKLGAHLLTINSQEENDFVVARISEDPLITSRVWLGMEMNHLGSPLAWVDNSSLGFSNWGTSRATVGDGLNPPCVVMETGNRGLWRRTSCTDSHSRVVCKTASTRSRGAPVALVLFLVIVLALLGFLVYKKKRAYFSSTVRYKRDFGEEDTTRIMTEDE